MHVCTYVKEIMAQKIMKKKIDAQEREKNTQKKKEEVRKQCATVHGVYLVS